MHAAAQVVSFLTPLAPAELVPRLAAVMPPDMAVIEAVPTQRAFNAKNLCSSRQYEYLLPTFTLARVSNPEHIAGAPPPPPPPPLCGANARDPDTASGAFLLPPPPLLAIL